MPKKSNIKECHNACKPMLAKRLPSIFIGEKQPVECSNCESKEGYQYSDFIKLHYTTFHDKEGKHDGGSYSESAIILNKGITPYCLNCGERLKFKLIRESIEELEKKKHDKNSYNDVIRDLKIIALEYAKQFQKEETQKCNVCGQQFDEDEECPTGHRQL